MVMTPVPPTPATTMPQARSAGGSAGSGSGGSADGLGRAFPPFFADFICPPSTVTKLGQKPLTQE